MAWTKKVYELDPRHENLLEDHWSGYVWVRSTNKKYKYTPLKNKQSVLFTKDLGESIRLGAVKKAQSRRMAGGVGSDFKRLGYVYSSVNFIKLFSCEAATDLQRAKAVEMILVTISKEKAAARLARYQRDISPDYQIKPKRVGKDPGSRVNQTIWVWAFENKSSGLSFPFIYSYVKRWEEETERKNLRTDMYVYNEQVRRSMLKSKKARARPIKVPEKALYFKKYSRPVGLSRREFAGTYKLTYLLLARLASGGINTHKGWTRISEPRRVSKEEARSVVDELDEKGEI